MPRKSVLTPAPPVPTMGPREVRAVRTRTGLAQAGFAEFLNVSHELVQAWESGRRRPRGAALRLLALAESHPEIVFPAAMSGAAVAAEDAVLPPRRPTPVLGTLQAMSLSTSFDALLCGPADHGVEFVVVGGVAAAIHGVAGHTDDVDIVYDRTPENLDRLAAFLRGVTSTLRGTPGRVPFAADPRTLAHTAALALDTRFGALDLRQRIAGVGDFSASRSLSARVSVAGRSLRVLTLDGLVAAKRASGRPKDRQQVVELEMIRRTAGG